MCDLCVTFLLPPGIQGSKVKFGDDSRELLRHFRNLLSRAVVNHYIKSNSYSALLINPTEYNAEMILPQTSSTPEHRTYTERT